MKYLLTVLMLFVLNGVFAQSEAEYWKKWDSNYPKTDVVSMLKKEQAYANNVEKHPEIAPYYVRNGKYSFVARYMGKVKLIDTVTISSMQRVAKTTLGNSDQINGLFKTAVLIKVGDQDMWMPIQEQMLKAFKDEVKTGSRVVLYTLYLNEHTSKGRLFNTFLISEFITQ